VAVIERFRFLHRAILSDLAHNLTVPLDHIQQAAADARGFVEGLAKDDFLADKRTQQAVIMTSSSLARLPRR